MAIYHYSFYTQNPTSENEEPDQVGTIEADSQSQALMKLAKKHGRLIKPRVVSEAEQWGGSKKR